MLGARNLRAPALLRPCPRGAAPQWQGLRRRLQSFDSLLATGPGHRSQCQGQRSAGGGAQVVKSEPEAVHRVPWMLGAGLTCLWWPGHQSSLQAAHRSPAVSVKGRVQRNQAYHGTTLVKSSSAQPAAPHGSSTAPLCRHPFAAQGPLGRGHEHRSVRSHCRSAPKGPADKRRPSVKAALPWQHLGRLTSAPHHRRQSARQSAPRRPSRRQCAASSLWRVRQAVRGVSCRGSSVAGRSPVRLTPSCSQPVANRAG